MNEKTVRLEDFGAHGVVSPAERFRDYQQESKGLARKCQARFWLEVLERDSQVRKLARDDRQPELTTIPRRSSRWKQKRRN
jgi:hypothetical protein